MVAFDMLGTFFALDELDTELAKVGVPPISLKLYFAEALRDAFALSNAGSYQPFKEILRAALPRIIAEFGASVDKRAEQVIIAKLNELAPVPSAEAACHQLVDNGIKILALTNASAHSTKQLLERAGLATYFSEVLSCDEVQRTKPHPAVYELAKQVATGDELWLISAHAWDVMGAAKAGLLTAWVNYQEKEYLEVYPPPDVIAPDLLAAARAVVN